MKGENEELEKRGILLTRVLKSFKEHYYKGNLEGQANVEIGHGYTRRASVDP